MSGQDWPELRHHILSELNRLNANQLTHSNKIDELKDSQSKQVQKLMTQLVGLKTRVEIGSWIFGAAGGVIAAMVAGFIKDKLI